MKNQLYNLKSHCRIFIKLFNTVTFKTCCRSRTVLNATPVISPYFICDHFMSDGEDFHFSIHVIIFLKQYIYFVSDFY